MAGTCCPGGQPTLELHSTDLLPLVFGCRYRIRWKSGRGCQSKVVLKRRRLARHVPSGYSSSVVSCQDCSIESTGWYGNIVLAVPRRNSMLASVIGIFRKYIIYLTIMSMFINSSDQFRYWLIKIHASIDNIVISYFMLVIYTCIYIKKFFLCFKYKFNFQNVICISSILRIFKLNRTVC